VVMANRLKKQPRNNLIRALDGQARIIHGWMGL
jgi:hypothetical protein